MAHHRDHGAALGGCRAARSGQSGAASSGRRAGEGVAGGGEGVCMSPWSLAAVDDDVGMFDF
jgi:hypothetical protein